MRTDATKVEVGPFTAVKPKSRPLLILGSGKVFVSVSGTETTALSTTLFPHSGTTFLHFAFGAKVNGKQRHDKVEAL